MHGDASICYKTYGAGTPLILMHGGLSSSLDWIGEIPDLARNFLVVVVDLRGHGRSSLGDSSISYRSLAVDVVAVMDKLDISRADVAGWSDGGNVGLLMALQHPERVNRLVAVSSNYHPDGIADEILAELADSPGEAGSWFSRFVYRLQSPHPNQWLILRDQVTAMWQTYPQLTVADLERIQTQTLLILGGADDIDRQHGEQMAAAMPNAELVILPGIGHAVTRDAAVELTSLMRGFLTPGIMPEPDAL